MKKRRLIFIMSIFFRFLLVAIIVTGCHSMTSVQEFMNPVHYTFKADTPRPIITKARISENPNVGVAMLSREGRLDTYSIERGIYTFVHSKAEGSIFKEIIFTDIGSILELDRARTVTNAAAVLKACPGMRYAVCFWKDSAEVTHSDTQRGRLVKLKSSGKEKVKTVYDDVYTSTISVKAEIVLYDLIDEVVLAKAVKKFKHTEEYVEEDDSPCNLWGYLSHNHGAYPEVDFKDVDRKFDNYLYYFLIRLSRTEP